MRSQDQRAMTGFGHATSTGGLQVRSGAMIRNDSALLRIHPRLHTGEPVGPRGRARRLLRLGADAAGGDTRASRGPRSSRPKCHHQAASRSSSSLRTAHPSGRCGGERWRSGTSGRGGLGTYFGLADPDEVPVYLVERASPRPCVLRSPVTGSGIIRPMSPWRLFERTERSAAHAAQAALAAVPAVAG
jgi:hypothetical protein